MLKLSGNFHCQTWVSLWPWDPGIWTCCPNCTWLREVSGWGWTHGILGGTQKEADPGGLIRQSHRELRYVPPTTHLQPGADPSRSRGSRGACPCWLSLHLVLLRQSHSFMQRLSMQTSGHTWVFLPQTLTVLVFPTTAPVSVQHHKSTTLSIVFFACLHHKLDVPSGFPLSVCFQIIGDFSLLR